MFSFVSRSDFVFGIGCVCVVRFWWCLLCWCCCLVGREVVRGIWGFWGLVWSWLVCCWWVVLLCFVVSLVRCFLLVLKLFLVCWLVWLFVFGCVFGIWWFWLVFCGFVLVLVWLCGIRIWIWFVVVGIGFLVLLVIGVSWGLFGWVGFFISYRLVVGFNWLLIVVWWGWFGCLVWCISCCCFVLCRGEFVVFFCVLVLGCVLGVVVIICSGIVVLVVGVVVFVVVMLVVVYWWFWIYDINCLMCNLVFDFVSGCLSLLWIFVC